MEHYFHVFYTIEPRGALAERLHGRLDAALADPLLKQFHYSAQESDDPSWSDDDRLAQAKCVFLRSLRLDYRLTTEAERVGLFGSADNTVAMFDRWWTIRRGVADAQLGNARGILPYVSDSPPAGNARVEEWVREQRAVRNIVGSVVFHNEGNLEISPVVHAAWSRPVLEVLVASGAAVSGFGNMVDSASAGFVGWCLAKDPPVATMGLRNLPDAGLADGDIDPFEWYDRVMAKLAAWRELPYLVDLDRFAITHRGETVWPPDKVGTKPPADPRRPRPGSPFVWGWYGTDLGDYRECEGTYGCFPWAELPSVPVPLDGSFGWLRRARRHDRTMGDTAATETALGKLLADASLSLPAEFVTFFRAPELWRHISSCTDCYFDLDTAAVPVRSDLGRVVRFLSDSQGCVHWSLWLSACETRQAVVATYLFSGSGEGVQVYPRDVTACSDSFEEFLYRFWIENELWYALNDGGPMPEGGEPYLEHYRRRKFEP